MTFLDCMSSWEKWVFPQEVKAFPSPSFSPAFPVSVCSLDSPSPSKPFILSYFFFSVILTSSTPKYSATQYSSHEFLCHLCKALNHLKEGEALEGWRQSINAVSTSICFTLNPYGGHLISDSCSWSGPRGSAKVKTCALFGNRK